MRVTFSSDTDDGIEQYKSGLTYDVPDERGRVLVLMGRATAVGNTSKKAPANGGSVGAISAVEANAAIAAAAAAGMSFTVIQPSGDTTGATDATAIQAALDVYTEVRLAAGTFYTNAALIIRKHGVKLIGASAGDIRNALSLGAGGTVIKPTVAVSKAIQIAKTADYVTMFELRRFAIDMANMTDASSSIGIEQGRSYNAVVADLSINNRGSNKVPYKALVGAYVTRVENCQMDVLQLVGDSLADAATTFTIVGGSYQQIYLRQAATCAVLAATIQGSLDKFDVDVIDGLTIVGCDIEGTGNFLKFGATSAINVYVFGNQFSGFSGTYQSGNPSGGRNIFLDPLKTYLNAGQNFGIGTNNPTQAFVLNGSGAMFADFTTSDANQVGLRFGYSGSANGANLIFSSSGAQFATNSALPVKLIVNGTTVIQGDASGNAVFHTNTGAPTLGTNGQMSFQRVSDTQLKILMRGADGTTRSTTLTLS